MNKQLVKLFKALSDQTRLDIVKKLFNNKKELSCRELQKKFPLSQPTLSHHFNKLTDAGILKVRKQGTGHFYSVNRKYLTDFGINIGKLIKS
jgi:DNA-binding transcriptional ArsR family regulator